MSARLEIDTSDLDRLQRNMDALTQADTRQLMDDIGAAVASQTQNRIKHEKTGPEGEEWPELSEAYAARKAGVSSGGLLELEGDLVDSMTWVVLLSGDGVDVGSNQPYAARQHFGGGGIPPRPYLGISDENADDLDGIVEDFLEGLINVH